MADSVAVLARALEEVALDTTEGPPRRRDEDDCSENGSSTSEYSAVSWDEEEAVDPRLVEAALSGDDALLQKCAPDVLEQVEKALERGLQTLERVREYREKLEDATWLYPPQPYPAWPEGPSVGEPGFSEHAGSVLQAHAGATDPVGCMCSQDSHTLQPFQRSVAFLAHPNAPTQRLLVCHQIGSGKTLTMLSTLENYYLDPRPKVVIFPSEPVVLNFYSELVKFPSSWRDFYCEAKPVPNWQASRFEVAPAWTKEVDLQDVVSVLEMKRSFRGGKWMPKYREDWASAHPDVRLPAAPLRAYRYTIAGGATCALKEGKTAPANPLLKILFDGRNPYSNKVVLLDEIHNLVRPTKWKAQLQALRDMLMTAHHTALLGLTGTPIQNSAEDITRLLKVIKGPGSRKRCDEGFVSCFLSRPRWVFPSVEAMAVHDVTLAEDVLRKYLAKHAEFASVEGKLALPGTLEKLGGYGNMSLFYTQHSRPPAQRCLQAPARHAPKLLHAVELVQAARGKCAIFIHRRKGLQMLVKLLRHLAPGLDVAQVPAVPGERTLADFNRPSNARGEETKVAVVDTRLAGEGISFLAVRHVVLVDVPDLWADYEQYVGRAVRMCGHHQLPPDDHSVSVAVLCAQLPRPRWLYEAMPAEVAGPLAEELARKEALLAELDEEECDRAAWDLVLGGDIPVAYIGEAQRALRHAHEDGPDATQDAARLLALQAGMRTLPAELYRLAAVAVDSGLYGAEPAAPRQCEALQAVGREPKARKSEARKDARKSEAKEANKSEAKEARKNEAKEARKSEAPGRWADEFRSAQERRCKHATPKKARKSGTPGRRVPAEFQEAEAAEALLEPKAKVPEAPTEESPRPRCPSPVSSDSSPVRPRARWLATSPSPSPAPRKGPAKANDPGDYLRSPPRRRLRRARASP